MNRILFFAIIFLIGNQLFAQVVKEVNFPQPDAEHEDWYGISVPVAGRALPEVTVANVIARDGRQINADKVVPVVHVALKKKQPIAIISLPMYIDLDGVKTALASCTVTIETSEASPSHLLQRPTGVANSVLTSGSWYKIAVKKRGIYKIDYAFLQSLGLNPSQINPAKIRLYGNGGTVLPEQVTSGVIDDLEENSIYVNASGSSFGQNDYILFYAGGPVKWDYDIYAKLFEHTPNFYEDNSYYFLNFDIGNGKRISGQAATGTANITLTSFDDYTVVEADSFNPGTVGKVWWGYRLINPGSGTSSLSFNVNMGTLTGPVTMQAQVGGVMDVDGNNYNISINNVSDTNITLNRPASSANMYAAFINKKVASGSGNMTIKTTLTTGASGAAYLDFMRFNARRSLTMSGTGGQLLFRDTAGYVSSNNIQAAFKIQSANANTKVWEVTNPLHPRNLNGSLSGTNYTIVRPTDSLREYIAFDGSQYFTPAFIGPVEHQNLHGLPQADLLIITRQDLLPAAEELANFHRNTEGLSVNVATVDKIYNEFSSGGQDISGIRNFIKMFYDRANGEDELPKNVLLLGAASYDYKDRIAANTNIVPVYQTAVSIANSYAFSSDDFYALLDEGESMASVSLLDVGVGRIPAYNLEEAQDVVEKINHYKQNASFGPWKNTFTFVSDNVDPSWTTSHTRDAEAVSEVIQNASPVYNQVKLYGDVFPLESTPSGNKMIAQNKALNDQIFLGTFLINYSGHGAPVRLAAEDLVTQSDINSWVNINKLPVFVTATCDFGRFDDPANRSGGARIMMKNDGGSIASLTTTQLVYPGPNSTMNTFYLQNQFNKNEHNRWNSLGEAVMNAKNESVASGSFGQYQNNQKFALLGDPALILALPQYNVRTDSLLILDQEHVTSDTIKALGRYKLNGSVTDEHNSLMTGFNGKVYVTIFDKPSEIPIVSDPMPPDISEYSSQTSVIYKGIATVTNGQFSLSFVVPKDINYSFGNGKISYYADDSLVDASGADTTFTVGGFSANAPEDNEGPVVQAFIDNDKFREGGVTGPDPLLFVKLSDDNGINVTGSSIGHDLVAILDDDADNPFVLNNYYQTNPDDFQSGTVSFPMSGIAPGRHRIRVKAWDTYNNSGEGAVTFEVVDKSQGAISEVYNYPNPFTQQTTFVIQHNLSKENLDVIIRVYNTSGQLVRSLEQNITPEGNRTEIGWDGESDNGFAMSSGVYFYKVQIKTKKGIYATAQQKLSLIR